MEGEAEYTGKTVEDAVAHAAAALGIPRGDLEYDVISAGSRGVFGIGAEDARVRAWPHQEAAPVPAAPETQAPAAAPRVAGGGEESAASQELWEDEEEPAPAPQTPEQREALAEEALEVTKNLLASMNIEATVTVYPDEQPMVVAITGDNLGVLIGRRGDNLSALQFMVNLILSRHRRQWPRVVIDVENYRQRREEALRTLADRMAHRVRRNGRPFTLEAMPAGDRRIIHVALRDSDDIETYSIGEGPERRVVIAPRRSS